VRCSRWLEHVSRRQRRLPKEGRGTAAWFNLSCCDCPPVANGLIPSELRQAVGLA
jgi:hypothetical protein